MILNLVEKQRSHYLFKWAVEKSVVRVSMNQQYRISEHEILFFIMTTQKYNCLLLYAYYVIQHMATPKGKIAKL
jgi:hypothetical protein